MAWIAAFAFPLLALLAGNLWWRWASRRRSLPCPTLFAGALESPLMDRLAGTWRTLDRIGLKSGLLVLEIGPGPGRLLIPASQQVLPDGRVVGLDIQPGMLKRLSARAAQAGLTNLKTILGDAVDSHFSPESFDLIFLCTVLGEIPDRLAALQQCNTALKPNGQLSITEIFPDPHYQSPEIVKKLAETAGFKLKEIVGNWYFYTANFEKARAGELE